MPIQIFPQIQPLECKVISLVETYNLVLILTGATKGARNWVLMFNDSDKGNDVDSMKTFRCLKYFLFLWWCWLWRQQQFLCDYIAYAIVLCLGFWPQLCL